MVTLAAKLLALAKPSVGFIRSIRVTEQAVGGYWFANGWMIAPPAMSKLRIRQLDAMPVSGRAGRREEALELMMMEAIERNSSTFLGNEKLIEGRASQLSAARWRQFLPYSNRQLAMRGAAHESDAYWVGESLSNKARVRYAEGVSLIDGKTQLAPAALVYLAYQTADEAAYAIANSNGCASGATKEDAIFRGLLEVIERDAFGIWWFNRIPRVGLTWEGDEALCEVAAWLDKERRWLELVELTTDVGVPVVAALTGDEQGGRIYVGCASGTSEVSAARKAASEALGFCFWGSVATDPIHRRRWLSEETVLTQSWLRGETRRPLETIERVSFGDSGAVAGRLLALGTEPFAIDLTKEYLGIPVTRVMAPGLVSHLPQFASGRLFDVPVRMGWLQTARSEEELLGYEAQL